MLEPFVLLHSTDSIYALSSGGFLTFVVIVLLVFIFASQHERPAEEVFSDFSVDWSTVSDCHYRKSHNLRSPAGRCVSGPVKWKITQLDSAALSKTRLLFWLFPAYLYHWGLPDLGTMEVCWSFCQQSLGKGSVIPWINGHSEGKQPFTLTQTYLGAILGIRISPNLHVFRLWEETGAPVGGDNVTHCWQRDIFHSIICKQSHTLITTITTCLVELDLI